MATSCYILLACLAGVALTKENQKSLSIQEIPLEYMRSSGLLDGVKNGSAYIELFLKKHRGVPKIHNGLTMPKKNSGKIERTALAIQKNHVGCDPHQTIVELPNDRPNVLFYPSCVKVNRCGGCCGHSRVECAANETSNVTVQVLQYIYDGTSVNPVGDVQYVSIEEHNTCECQCKIKAADCNPEIYNYDDYECKCSCKAPRTECPTDKQWDEGLCGCRCSFIQECGAGYHYNMSSCSCEDGTLMRQASEPLSAEVIKVDKPATIAPVTMTEISVADACLQFPCPRRYKKYTSIHGKCSCKFDRSARGR